MRFVLLGAVAVAVGLATLHGRGDAPQPGSVTTIPLDGPQPIGITAALLMNARFADSKPESKDTDILPVPSGGNGPLVVVGDAGTAVRAGASYFVPVETMHRSTGLTQTAAALEISPRTVWAGRNRYRLIDLREEHEFAASRVSGSERRSMFSELADKEMPVALFCLTGHRSAAVVSQLRRRGITNVYSVKGGWLDWRHQQLPLEFPESSPNYIYVPERS